MHTKQLLKLLSGYLSEIHCARLLMEVSQVNSCPDHLGLCSLLFAFPEWCPATSAPFLPDTLLRILPHSVQKLHSPGSLLQFPLEQLLALSPRISLSPTSIASLYVIYLPPSLDSELLEGWEPIFTSFHLHCLAH